MEDNNPIIVAADEIPLPPALVSQDAPPLQSQMPAGVQNQPGVVKPIEKFLPKTSKKGIEQAKKMLRAFSIQRKQTVPPVKITVPGSTVVAGSTNEALKLKPKPEKSKKSASHPSFNPLKDEFQKQNEELRRKIEIAELGIPLSLIQPDDKSMVSKAWPSKAMPPTLLLTPEQVDELIMKAREAKAAGKTLKFNYKDYFPDYENPFHPIKKSDNEPNSPVKTKTDVPKIKKSSKDSTKKEKTDIKGKSSSKQKTIKSRWDDTNYKPKSKGASPKSRLEKEDKEVNLNDFVVCDSWSLDTDDKIEEPPCKLDDKNTIADVDATSSNFVEVRHDIEIPKGLPPPRVTELEKIPETNKNENLSQNIIVTKDRDKFRLKKLRPVIDGITYDLSDDSSDSLENVNKYKIKTKVVNETEDKKDDTPKEIEEKTVKKKLESKNFIQVKDIPLPSRSISKSPYTDTKSKSEKSSRSNSSRKNEQTFDTPDYLKGNTKNDECTTLSQDYDTPKTQTDTSGFNEPMTPDFDEEYLKYEDEKSTPKIPGGPTLSKEMEESLDTWNFVLKICQPLLFRHDRNKCYKETKTQPSIWYAKNPKICSCVKDREVVYEELNVTKMEIVDKVYGCDQIIDDTPIPTKFWYPRLEHSLSEISTIMHTFPPILQGPKTIATPVPPPESPIDETRNSLDREYQKFMEAVWTDKVEKKSKNSARDAAKDLTDKDVYWKDKRGKSKETSELGTSMDESVMSMDGQKLKKKKKKKDSSEYWSGESDVESKSSRADRPEKRESEKIKKKKKKKVESDESSDSVDTISESSAEKKKKKKKLTRVAKKKLARKKRLERKQRLKKIKEKRMRKMRKLKEKVQKSLEHDEDIGDIIKKEKQKKKEEVKGKKNKKLKPKKKDKSKKKKISSSSSSSSSSDSSSESEREKRKRKRKKESAKRQKKRKPSESYSEVEEEFDMNILQNIKMEQMSEDESNKAIEDFSPRRPAKVVNKNNKEIVSVTELHSDFIGRTIKEERLEFDERTKDNDNVEAHDSAEKIDHDDKEINEEATKTKKMAYEEKSIITPEIVIPSPVAEDDPKNLTLETLKGVVDSREESPVVTEIEKVDAQLDAERAREKDAESMREKEAEIMREKIRQQKLEKRSRDRERQIEEKALEVVKCQERTLKAELEARPIETVVSATASRGEIKCDWRPTPDSLPAPHVKSSRWGMQSKPGEANIVLTQSEEAYPVPPHVEQPAQPQYKIETISSMRGETNNDYDGAYADMYGESDRLQYGDCFSVPCVQEVAQLSHAVAPRRQEMAPRGQEMAPRGQEMAPRGQEMAPRGQEMAPRGQEMAPRGQKIAQRGQDMAQQGQGESAPKKVRLSLDDRIGLVFKQSVLAPVTEDKPQQPERIENGILINRLSPSSGRESTAKGIKPSTKRVSFADGYNPGQDSDSEQPPTEKKRRRRYGCAWPCPASHPDHVPLWDALPPPPPPPGSPPPPPAPLAPPAHLLRAAKRARRHELPLPMQPSDEPAAKVTRLPQGLGHPTV